MERRIKAGIVGFGYMGRFHLRKSRLCQGIEVTAAYEPEKSRAGEARQEGLITARSLEELLAMKDLDLILVCTPNDSHKAISIAALEAGKHVLCEKPATLSAAEAEEVTAAAEKAGRIYTVHQNRRWDHDYLQVKKVLEEGTIGSFTTINSWVYGQRGVCFGWRADPAKGGGMLYDWGVHLIDQALNLYPGRRVERVFGRMESILTPAVDDFFEAKLFFDNGVCANISVGTFSLQETPRWLIFGDRGTLKLDDFDELSGGMARIRAQVTGFDSVFGQSRPEDGQAMADAGSVRLGPSRTMAPLEPEFIEQIPLLEVPEQPLEFYRNLIAAIRGEEAPYVTHAEIVRDMRILDAVIASNQRKQVVETNGTH